MTIAYRRERPDMPAISEEVTDAEAEGVQLRFLVALQRVVTDERGRITGIEPMRTTLGDFGLDGRRRLFPPARRASSRATTSLWPSENGQMSNRCAALASTYAKTTQSPPTG